MVNFIYCEGKWFNQVESTEKKRLEKLIATAAVSIYTTKIWYLNPIENGTTNLTI